MTAEQIHQLYEQKINIKGIHKVLEVDKDTIANYRRRIDTMSLGLKMELLLKMGEIDVFPKSYTIEVGGKLTKVNIKDVEKSWEGFKDKNDFDDSKTLAELLLEQIQKEANLEHYIDLLGKAGEKANGSFEVHRDGGSSIEDFKKK
jgi:hypothetical protein